eukprot:6114830-Pleurochrysis_carterae.AAC.2
MTLETHERTSNQGTGRCRRHLLRDQQLLVLRRRPRGQRWVACSGLQRRQSPWPQKSACVYMLGVGSKREGRRTQEMPVKLGLQTSPCCLCESAAPVWSSTYPSVPYTSKTAARRGVARALCVDRLAPPAAASTQRLRALHEARSARALAVSACLLAVTLETGTRRPSCASPFGLRCT